MNLFCLKPFTTAASDQTQTILYFHSAHSQLSLDYLLEPGETLIHQRMKITTIKTKKIMLGCIIYLLAMLK